MKNTFSTIILLLLFVNLFAQKQTLSGYILDISSGEKLIGATIYSPKTQTGTATNNFGFYSISLPKTDTLTLSVSYLGYQTQEIILNTNKDTKLNIHLQKTDNTIKEVTVTAQNQIQNRVEMSTIEIPISQIKTLPALGGEIDIMKAVQLMPGVQSGGEGQSGLYVRGGSADQNLILLDDVPLYYVNHLGGFVSIFNTDAINTIKLTKGGFPASYGNRLSSVFDIRMKDGNMKKFEYQGTIGLISSKFSIEGPIKKDKTSFIFSARRFMLDLITKPISLISTGSSAFGYTFYDINAKINHKFSDKDRIYFSFYVGDDKTSVNMFAREDIEKEKMKSALRWGNMLGAIRWNHIYGNKLFSNLTLTYTRYRYLTEFYYKMTEDDGIGNKYITEYENKFNSGIKDFNLKLDFEYYQSANYKLKFGANSIFHIFTPGISSYKRTETEEQPIDTTFNNQTYYAFENSIYLENHINIGKRIKTNLGIRASAYTIDNKTFYSVEPRILTNFLITKNFSIKTSYALMQQTVHLLSYSGLGMPTDLWVPATKNVPPEKAHQFAVGIAQTLFKNKFEFSVEGYYKNMNNLITYKESTSFYSASKNWEENVLINGKGKSYGIEFLLQKKQGKFTGWVGYTLSRTDRHFTELNLDRPYLYRYDRTHDINIVLNYKINEKINIAATWVYGTGNAITLPNEYYKVPEIWYQETFPYNYYANTTTVESYAEKNSFRMRAFHKLDIGINFTKQKKRGERIWNFSIYNLYNRQNPYFYFFKNVYETDEFGKETGKYEKKLFQQSLFPIIPSISYSFKF